MGFAVRADTNMGKRQEFGQPYAFGQSNWKVGIGVGWRRRREEQVAGSRVWGASFKRRWRCPTGGGLRRPVVRGRGQGGDGNIEAMGIRWHLKPGPWMGSPGAGCWPGWGDARQVGGHPAGTGSWSPREGSISRSRRQSLRWVW